VENSFFLHIADKINNPRAAFDRASTDPIACTTLHILNLIGPWTPTYGYEFTYPPAPYYFPRMPGFQPLAAHTIDIQFLFPGYHGGNLGVNLDQTTGRPRELNAQETRLSDELVTAWTKFARYGNRTARATRRGRSSREAHRSRCRRTFRPRPAARPSSPPTTKCDYWLPALGL
jgi:carboxylesterase type B